MITELKKKKLINLLRRQISNFFFLTKNESKVLEKTISPVLFRLKNCISAS